MKRIIVSLVSLILVSGCSTIPNATTVSEQRQPASYQAIFIVSHGWHTGIVYPREELLSFIPELRHRFGDAQYLEIGWGDKDFYQAQEVTAAITLKAIFWSTESVVHVVSVPTSPYESFPNSEIRLLCLDQAQLQSLGQFISNSFHRDQQGKIVVSDQGLYGDSQFYAGEGRFNMFNTCNKWTARGLESAGYDIDPSSTLTASSVMDYLDLHVNQNRPKGGTMRTPLNANCVLGTTP